jgi:iron complex outermembrane receptor protein
MHRQHLGCLAILALAAPSLAPAQTAATNAPVELPPIIVEGTPISKYRAETVSTATLFDAPPEEIPSFVDVLTEDFINEVNPTDLYDLLRHQAGVFASGGKSPQDRNPGVFTLRGMSGSEPKLDGALGFSGPMALFMDPAAFERVEIIKGPIGSTIGGTASSMGDALGAGGTVNVVLKHPSLLDSFQRVNARSVFGDDTERFRLGFDLNEPLAEEKAAVRLPGSVEYSKPFWLPGDYRWRESFFLAPSALWHVRDDLRFGVNLTLQYTDQPAYQGIPTYRGKPIPGFSWDTDTASSSMRDVYTGFTVQPYLEWDAARWLTLRSGFGYAFSDLEFEHLSNGGSYYNARTGGVNLYAIPTYEHSEGDTLIRSWNAYERATARFDTGPASHTLVGQFDYNRRIVQGRQYFASVANPNDVHLWVPANYQHTDLQKWGFLGQDFIALWKFRFLGGVRYDIHESNLGNTAESLSPRGGVSFVATDWLIPFANISLTEAPNLGRLTSANKELTSSWRATQYEGGLRVAPVQDLWLTVSYYHISQENLPVAQVDANGVATGFFDLEGENESKGVELSLAGNITDNWSVYAAYAYNDYTDKTTGLSFYRFPPHSITASTSYRLTYGPLNDLVAGFGYRYRHKYYSTIRGAFINDDFFVDDSHVFDCSLDIPMSKFGGSKDVILSLAVKNIFDERYIESNRHYYQCFPGDPRTFELALRASF